MAIQIRVRLGKQIIVPVRFTRAVTGAPAAGAPEVDDRGFALGTRPGTWGATDARGAMVAVAAGDTIQVKVLREDIDAAAPLFVTSTDPSLAAVASPSGGGPLSANGVFQLSGVSDKISQPVKIQVRLGAADGPVLGEMEPHIFQLRERRIRMHLVTINGTPTVRTAQSLVAVVDEINQIWRPAGIRFLYNPAETREETINGFVTAGRIGSAVSEFSRVINLRPDPNAVNMYCVQDIDGAFGLTFSNSVARPTGFGIAIRDDSVSNSNAHELCHFLDNDEHSTVATAGGPNVRTDMWVRRRLLSVPNPFPATGIAHRDDVGYGASVRGAQITVKDLPGDPFDGEQARSRRRSLNPF